MRVLAVNFFPAFHPPRSGGEQRYYYFYRYLSERYDVTLLSPTYSGHASEIVPFSPSFREYRVPKDAIFDRLHWKLGAAGIGPECSGYVVALAAARDTAFGRQFASLVKEADLIIHDSPFTLPYDRTIDRDGKPRIYNAYNVEHRLAAQFFEGDAGRKAVEFIRFLEIEMIRRSRLVLVTSREEGEQFSADFNLEPGKIVLAPNGFEPAAREVPTPPSMLERGGVVLFMGSAHPPNVEAARHVVERLAPAIPRTQFKLIGAVCAHLPEPLPDNVQALGFVDEEVKRDLLRTCGAAINPLFSGAGTNLKMLDYMAAGAPIVTTLIGGRGLQLSNGVNAFIADGHEFAAVLRAVLGDKPNAWRVGAAARQKAFSEYTWEHIAGRVRGTLESRVGLAVAKGGNDRRPFLLVVNDFSVLNPTGGGQVRIHELMTELGRSFEVALLCLSSEPERYQRAIAAHVVEIGIPKTPEHRDAEVEAARGETVSIGDLLAADHVLRNVEFVSSFRALARRSATVVFEHPFLAPLAQTLPIDLPVVYSSLNVETDLKANLLALRRDGVQRIAQVVELEHALLQRADLVVCVSEQDRARFRGDFPAKQYVVVENGSRVCGEANVGVDTRVRRGQRRSLNRPLAIFIGSAHMPNVHGARFLVESVAPMAPEVVFGLVGSVCDSVRLMRLPPNVALFGVLSEQEKNALLRRATIAVNPLFDGGGSSLKVPDFLGAGLALVSTAVGVRGYDVQNGTHYLRAGREDFAEKVRLLATDSALRVRLAAQAHAFAESRLDWHVLGGKYRDALRSLMGLARPTRVLVVTYRFADPAPGGAEAYLGNLLRAMSRRGNVVIDVSAPDVGSISNKWHFSAEYGPYAGPPHTPDYLESLRRFKIDDVPSNTFARCARLFALWMDEMREQARTFRNYCDRPMLLGGWNFEETRGPDSVRWSSLRSEIYVGKAAVGMSFRGFAARSTEIEISRGQTCAGSMRVSGDFSWDLPIDGNDDIVSLSVRDVFEAPSDPRELGVLVSAVVVRTREGDFPIAIGDDVGARVRREDPQAWVESLMGLAKRRERSVDDLFVAVRGPHCAALERWLESHCTQYDVVLVQGVPFATLVAATEITTRRSVPTVLLPHFHLEDRYYHWQSFYRVFAEADCVLAAPAASKPLFFDRLGATTTAVPGGGIDLEEYREERLTVAARMFRTLHAGIKPFVLVLGRKAGAKNYQQAIDAVQAVNRQEHRVDLVMIGPDEDGVPVAAPDTYCYGSQPRDVVLGALRLALCLVNMSDSESFGIVLLEAWRAGTPVVAQRRCAAFAELVESGENGVLVESVLEIVAAIDRYLTDPELARQHARKGSSVAERHSWSHVAEVIEHALVGIATTTSRAIDAARGEPIDRHVAC